MVKYERFIIWSIFKSEIITDLLRVLGCGVDGFPIRTLVLTMLYRLTPTLIQEGYVYIAEVGHEYLDMADLC